MPANPAPASQQEKRAPRVDLPPEIDRQGAASPVCQLLTEQTDRPTGLRLRPGGAVVLSVDANLVATVSIPQGTTDAGVFTELGGPGGIVRGWQDAADLDLHAVGSLVFGDFVVPQAYTSMRWTRADTRDGEGRLWLTFELDKHVRSRVSIERETRCDEVQLTPGESQVRAPLGDILYWGELATGTVPVRQSPGGPVIAEIDITPDVPRLVSVHEVQGKTMRVEYEASTQLVFGWVSQAMVTRLPDWPEEGWGHGAGFGRGGKNGGHSVEWICDHALPLVVQSKGEDLVTVGELAAGTVFKTHVRIPGQEVPPWSSIQLGGDRWVLAVGDSELVIPSYHLERCRAP